MKTKKLKTRRGWVWPAHLESPHMLLVETKPMKNLMGSKMIPVAVVPLDDPDQMVTAVAYTFWRNCAVRGRTPNAREAEDDARTALTALGILPKKRSK